MSTQALELENLVVTLTGEGSAYMRMLEQAQTATKQATSQIQSNSKQIEQFQQSITNFGQAAVSGLASLGIKSILTGIFDSAVKAEEGAIALGAAIRVNGGDAKAASAEYMKFADAMQSQMLVSKGTTLSLVRQAEMQGLTGKAAEDATTQAIALANATGREAESFIMATSMAAQGHTQMLRRIPGLRGIRDETEMVAKVNKMMAAGLEVQKSKAESMAGQLEKLDQATSAVKKQFGSLLLEAVKPVIGMFSDAVKWFQKLDEQTKLNTLTVAGMVSGVVALVPAFKSVKAAFALAFSGSGAVLAVLLPLALATSLWIQSVGGIGKAWGIVQQKVATFWAWVRPRAEAVWEGIKTGAVMVGTVIAGIWQGFLTLIQPVLDTLSEAFSTVGGYLSALTGNTTDLATATAMVTTAVLLAVGSYYALATAFSLLAMLYSALHINQLVSIGLWVAWKAVVLATTLVVALVKLAIGGLVAVFGLLSASILLAVAALALFAAAVVGIVAACMALGAAVVAVWEAIRSAPSVGGMSRITEMFNEWIGIVSDLVRAVKVDMGFAWRYAAQTFRLFLSEMRDLMPPLWEFIKSGFFALWDLAAAKFKKVFYEKMVDMASNPLVAAAFGLTGNTEAEFKYKVEQATTDLQNAKDSLQKVADKGLRFKESAQTEKEREELDKYKADLVSLEKLKADAEEERRKANEDNKRELDLATKINAKAKETIALKKIDASLAASAEALAKISAYRTQLEHSLKAKDAADALRDTESKKDQKGPRQQLLEAALKKSAGNEHLAEFMREVKDAENAKRPAQAVLDESMDELEIASRAFRDSVVKSGTVVNRFSETLNQAHVDVAKAMARRKVEDASTDSSPEGKAYASAVKAKGELDIAFEKALSNVKNAQEALDIRSKFNPLFDAARKAEEAAYQKTEVGRVVTDFNRKETAPQAFSQGNPTTDSKETAGILRQILSVLNGESKKPEVTVRPANLR